LTAELQTDAQTLIGVLLKCGDWDWQKDTKFETLYDLVSNKHSHEKILILPNLRILSTILKIVSGKKGWRTPKESRRPGEPN